MENTVGVTGNGTENARRRDILASPNVPIGEALPTATASGSIEVSAADRDFDVQMPAVREVMFRRKRALHMLAR